MPDPLTTAELALLANELPLPGDPEGLLFVLNGTQAALLSYACDVAADALAAVPHGYAANVTTQLALVRAVLDSQAAAYLTLTSTDLDAARVSCGLEPA